MSQCGSEGARISVSRLASLVDTYDVGDDGSVAAILWFGGEGDS